MKRKAIPVFISLVLAAALLLGMTPDAMAATSRCDILGHDWSGWKTTKSPTCTAQGSEERTCTRRGCGKKETRSIPAKGHSFKYLRTEQEATCTEDGIALFTCPQCSAKENRTIKAKGHEWDEGVITQPEGLLEGAVKTYTCLKCGETRTEEIPPETPKDGSSIMNALRGLPPGFSTMNLDLPLKIEKQPVGGFINHNGGSLTLSVEAAGGEPPYSYQWRRAYYSTWLPAINEWWDDVEGGTESTLEADRGKCRYYCRVTDSKGNRVKSDKVLVSWDLYIAEQPKNANLYGKESVTLSCRAAGGDPFRGGYGDGYSYGWIGPDGSVMNNPDTNEAGNELTVSEPGTYSCWVMDNGTREVYSDTALVYSALPVSVQAISMHTYMQEGETRELEARAGRGVQPLTGRWTRDGEEVAAPAPGTQVAEGVDSYLFPATADEFGTYVFTVTDAMGETASASVEVEYDQLDIAEQPEGGTIPDKGEHRLHLLMAEGEAPFTYTLYRNGEPAGSKTTDSMLTDEYTDQAGEYYFHIEDAAGRWADSDRVSVEEYSFRIEYIIPSGKITPSGDGVTLKAVTNGGTEPIEYAWWLQHERNGYVVAEERVQFGRLDELTANVPGRYNCVAKDAEGRYAQKHITVEYTGNAPIIIKHPRTITLVYEPNISNYVNQLECEAVAADGRTDCLEYEWEYKSAKGWRKAKDMEKGISYINGNAIVAKYNSSILAYRCVVTDTRNGEKTVSREGGVNSEVHCSILSVTGDMKSSGKITIRYVVEGGTAPYLVHVAASRVTGNKDGREERFSSLMGTAFIEDNKEHVYVIEKGDQYFNYFAEYSGGSYNKKGSRPDFYLAVEDANGKTCSSDYYPGK